MELPRTPFELNCGKVLLQGALLIVESKEESFFIKHLKVLSLIGQGESREGIVRVNGHLSRPTPSKTRLFNALILRNRHVLEGSIQVEIDLFLAKERWLEGLI